MRPAPGTALDTYLRDVAAEQAVKGESTLDRRATKRAQQHEGPGEQEASIGGRGPRTPKSRRAEKVDQRIGAVAAFLKTRRDQGVRHKSRGWVLPLDLCDTPGEQCGCGAVGWVAEGGKITARYRPGRKKGCPVCGRRLRARYWQGYGPILAAAGDQLRRLECSDTEWRKLSPKLRKAGHQALPVPVEDGRVVYTTAPIGEAVTDLAGQLAADLLVMADDTRRMRATGSAERPGWRQQWQAFLLAEEEATPAPTGEYLGFSGAGSLPRALMWAKHLGILQEEHEGGLVIRDVRESDPATWYLFAERVGIRKWATAEVRAVA